MFVCERAKIIFAAKQCNTLEVELGWRLFFLVIKFNTILPTHVYSMAATVNTSKAASTQFTKCGQKNTEQ